MKKKEKQKHWGKRPLITMLIIGAVLCEGIVFAAGESIQSYDLDTVIVTAQRTETRDLETPATTTVITARDLKEKGAISVYDALERVVGVHSYSYGSGGEDYGGMYSRIMVRGLDKGTLVLVNGTPVNLMNVNSMMSSIPVEAVERIEIVKGSNAVLYGAEAMGGVINIITKKPDGKAGGSITTTYGNYDKNYSAAVNGDKFELFYKKEYRGAIDQYNRLYTTSTKKIAKEKGTKDAIFLSYNITDDLTFNYAYADTDSHFRQYTYNKSTKDWTTLYKNYYYYDNRQNVSLVYNNKETDYKSVLAYNKNRFRPGGDATTNTDLSSYNFDNQKVWHLRNGKDFLVGGVTLQSEHYTQNYGAHRGNFNRDSYAVYTSYSRQLTDDFTAIVGLRGHFVQANEYDAAQNILLPQLQTVYKINDHTSWYTNIGKSFEMPACNSPFYGSGAVSTAIKLKPQEGWNYETGMKFIHNDESLKLAVFNMKIKNKFKWVKEDTVIFPGGDPNTSIQINQDQFRNTGIEIEYNKKLNDNWKYNLGVSYSNPEAKNGNDNWEQTGAKLQYSLGTTYTKNKFTANTDFFVTAKREMAFYNLQGQMTPVDHRVPNYVNLNLTLQYNATPNDLITLAGYNLLDRNNPINYNEYWSTPLNYRLSYTHNF